MQHPNRILERKFIPNQAEAQGSIQHRGLGLRAIWRSGCRTPCGRKNLSYPLLFWDPRFRSDTPTKKHHQIKKPTPSIVAGLVRVNVPGQELDGCLNAVAGHWCTKTRRGVKQRKAGDCLTAWKWPRDSYRTQPGFEQCITTQGKRKE